MAEQDIEKIKQRFQVLKEREKAGEMELNYATVLEALSRAKIKELDFQNMVTSGVIPREFKDESN